MAVRGSGCKKVCSRRKYCMGVFVVSFLRLAKISMTPFNWQASKTPSLVQNSGTYLKCELSYGIFCVEISTFSSPWQQGLSDTNFNYTVKSADPENPLFGARILLISHTS